MEAFMISRWLKLALFTLLLLISRVHAWDADETFGITESVIKSYVGFREDSLKWKIEGRRNWPVILEEVCFEDIKMIEKGLSSEVSFSNWTLEADSNVSFAYNKPHDWAWDLSIGAGYHFDLCNNSIRITPLVGYAIDRQRFHTCNENFLSDNCSTRDFITLAKLTSFYRAHWNSPWIGVNFHYAINECWKTYSDFAYHFVRLRGKGHTSFGDRNLNGFQERDRFRHRQHGWGFTWDVGLQYAIDCNWLLDTNAQFEYRKTHHGHQKGSHDVIGCKGSSSGSSSSGSDDNVKHRLKHVEWRSLRFNIGLAYLF
jgi:lipopolysaccharide assembly outer membrane protein LptD (OstA)